MKLNIMPGRIVVKQHAAKLKGVIQLPPNRAKLYEIGEVVAVGALEGYGPGGVAIYIEGVSDNKNRTTSEVRTIFSKRA